MMDQDDSAGADPQQTIRDLEQQAEKDKEALDKPSLLTRPRRLTSER